MHLYPYSVSGDPSFVCSALQTEDMKICMWESESVCVHTTGVHGRIVMAHACVLAHACICPGACMHMCWCMLVCMRMSWCMHAYVLVHACICAGACMCACV